VKRAATIIFGHLIESAERIELIIHVAPIQVWNHCPCSCVRRAKLDVVVLGQSPQPALAPAGSIHGTVVDQSGAMVAGARLKLAGEDPSRHQETVSGNDGQFAFANVAPGRFQITITSAGFASQTLSGTLHAGRVTPSRTPRWPCESFTDVEVGLSQIDVAEEQIKIEEKQRVLGVLPNFYVTYIRMQFRSPRSRSSSCMEDGDRSVHLGAVAELREWSRRKITLPNMARRAGLCKALRRAMPIRRLACSLVPPYCHRF